MAGKFVLSSTSISPLLSYPAASLTLRNMVSLIKLPRTAIIRIVAMLRTLVLLLRCGRTASFRPTCLIPSSKSGKAKLITFRTSCFPSAVSSYTTLHQKLGMAKLVIPLWAVASPTRMLSRSFKLPIRTYMVFWLINTATMPAIRSRKT